MKYKVIPFNQKNKKGWLTTIKSSEINLTATKNRLKVDQKSEKNPNGYQRPDTPSRWKAFATFMESDNGFCPVPLVGNVRTNGRGAHRIVENSGQIDIPENVQIWVCEGQHRLLGYLHFLKEFNTDVDIPLVILNEDRDQEVINFHYINAKQKSVATDLTNTILREYLKRTGNTLVGISLTDEKQIAIDVTSMLNDDPSCPFYKNIQLTGSGIKSTIKPIPMHNSITELVKEIDDTGMCDEDRVATMSFEIMKNAWRALRELMPDAFNESKDYVLLKSAGIYSVNRVIIKSVYKMKKHSENDFYKMFSSPHCSDYFEESWWKSNGGNPNGAVNYGSSQGAFRRIQKTLMRGVTEYLNTQR